ncbi:hypothetical protein BCR32DRAFT_243078 [Anaeromyces robustus]|uniref:Uncharacterized protein n=1 Tax=Anaeromyces robustus TaxID=1754192 RepID=A0A1Y1XE87_9FUNG|nr:hypothetical protein BCR32DRAFT_243078 [Anaeromyces robustus]|eukprot:ORX83766.1 hypothetical protein BCR32DRAFT_243078 [Anaeromyces robustus]
MSVDSSVHDSQVLLTASPSDKKLLNISINDQVNDRALRKIMDLEILNESLRSINESLECTIKEQSLKMEQLQLQIDHLKSASSLNSTNDDDFLFDFLLTKDTNSDSEIKIIPRHPQHAYRNSNQLSSSIPKDVKENEKLLEDINLNEDTDVQFKRICAKIELLINDANKAVALKPKEVEKELNKEKKSTFDPNDIKIERRHNNNNNNNINNNNESFDKNSIKVTDSNSTLAEDDISSSTNNSNNSNEELSDNTNGDLTKIDEEIINEKVNSKTNNINSQEKIKNTQSTSEIQAKYEKVFNIIEKLNTISKNVMNETKNIEQIHEKDNKNDQNKNQEQNKEEKSNTFNGNSSKGLAMLLNPLLSYQNTNNNDDNSNSNNTIPESSTNKIKELTNSMNNILENLMEVLNEEKQKELKESKEENENERIINNNVRCPVVITSSLPTDKPNKSGFNRRNSSVTSPKFNRSTSVERSVSANNDGSESMMKINAILGNNGNVVNCPGYPSILSSIPFKKDNKLFHRTRTWDPQYLNHYRSLSVQAPSSLRNSKSPTLVPSVVITSTSISNSNATHANENNNNSSTSTSTSTSTMPSTPASSTTQPQNHFTKPNINENEIKFQNFVQGLERKKTHLPSFYL